MPFPYVFVRHILSEWHPATMIPEVCTVQGNTELVITPDYCAESAVAL